MPTTRPRVTVEEDTRRETANRWRAARPWALLVGLVAAWWTGCTGGAAGGATPATGNAPAAAKPSDAPGAVHSRAPAFAAPDQAGKVRTLSEFQGKHIVLFFYPKDATPGCTKEACAFRDRWSEFEAAGAAVIGVSLDDVASHAEFAKEHGFQFPLLADTDGKIAEAYGVPTLLGFAKRMTFVIDGNGIIRRAFPDVDPAVHADEVLATLKSLNEVGAVKR